MLATLSLFACALATAQPADAPSGAIQPPLRRGQELLYRGSWHEEAKGQGVLFSRSCKLEIRVLALDVLPRATEAAFLTVAKAPPRDRQGVTDVTPSAVRLERAVIDPRGRLKPAAGTSLAVPLDGPPSIEVGMFVETPKDRLEPQLIWEVAEDNRPPCTWEVAGFEIVVGVRCMKLVGRQQSEDWERPRADHSAWRRQDTVWMAARAGYATKVERVIERREPAHKEPNLRLVLRYELDSALQYPGQLFEDRRREIQQALSLNEQMNTLLPRAGSIGPRPFEMILKRIAYHNQTFPRTPYRDALRRVQHLAELGKRGETPPAVPAASETAPVRSVIGVGRPAPDFLVQDIATANSVRLRRWLGRPILLVFYDPTAESAPEVLRFAQKTLESNSEQVTVLGMAVAEDAENVLRQKAWLRLTFPLLSGTGLRLSYAVEATPKLVVIDADGVVRSSYVGWGPEIPRNITADLKKCPAKGQ